ncbi:SHOCT domain-containing protein [Halocatena salina]|uniref:SHOCT domain-containing protein n=1 Tax=Halocatena salina TaxID=2934340 RepID=A0A8U0A0K2_9EURY|nr:SHOCT domain-containing protein [Halocatena salina]UPM42602.1 SHOCT domain-containing protein [Halocatena salina]
MSLESRIEQRGRRILGSPLWMGIVITAFLVAPVFFTPQVPLWMGLVSLTSLLPLVLGSTYLADYIYRRVVDSDSTDVSSPDSPVTEEDVQTPIERLRHAYARGEIGEEAFERRLERLLETENIHHRMRTDATSTEKDLITE